VQALLSSHKVEEGALTMVQDDVPLHVCVWQVVDVHVTVPPATQLPAPSQ
jgi:hypothetical protein